MSNELNTVLKEVNSARRVEGLAPVTVKGNGWVIVDYIYDQLASETLYGARTARQALKRKQLLERAKDQVLETA